LASPFSSVHSVDSVVGLLTLHSMGKLLLHSLC